MRWSALTEPGQNLLGAVGAHVVGGGELGGDRVDLGPVAPATMAMLRACRAMWPRWMPSVASALRAAMFWARPTATVTSASSCAVSTPRIFSESWASGWVLVAPPTRPSAMGISSVPTRRPSVASSHVVSEV
jgi:hypothetical protein